MLRRYSSHRRRHQGASGSSSGGHTDRRNPYPLESWASGGARDLLQRLNRDGGRARGRYSPLPSFITRLYRFPQVEAGWFMGRDACRVDGGCGLGLGQLDTVVFRLIHWS